MRKISGAIERGATGLASRCITAIALAGRLMHTGAMKSLFAQCRYMLARSRGFRALWVLTMLGLMVASVPRWELHQHVVVSIDHGVAAQEHDHRHGGIAYTDADGGVLLTHLHSAPAFSVAFIQSVLPSLERQASSADEVVPRGLAELANCWPPPHRPPIV
jgi:hypothetical protein